MESNISSGADDKSSEVPDGELCVVCLMRWQRRAFIPCGLLVCCLRCAQLVQCDSDPKCSVCRQTIHNSMRICDS